MLRTRYRVLVAWLTVSLLCLVLAQSFLVTSASHPAAARMRRAAQLADSWLRIVEEAKARHVGMPPPAPGTRHAGLLGEELTPLTTTLGSLEAKVTALNPDFAALILRLLSENAVDSSKTVGVVISGSFPGLAISALAAVRTLGARAVLISSLGASSFGANQPGATWLDMERWLQEGGVEIRSDLVTRGAEGDTGGGLDEEGLKALQDAAGRSGTGLYVPQSLIESIETKLRLLRSQGVDFLINIGGNQASLGGCRHSSIIPTGVHRVLPRCDDADRGLLVRASEAGIPVLHLLNIRDVAFQYGLPVGEGDAQTISGGVYAARAVNRPVVALLLLFVLVGPWLSLRPQRN